MITSWLVVLPILIPFCGAVLGLLLRRYWRIQLIISLVALSSSLGCSIASIVHIISSNSPIVFQVGGWQAPVGISIVGDSLSAFLVVMSQVIFFAGIFYSAGCKDKCIRYPAYFPLYLLMVTGLAGAFLTGDLFNLFVFAELMVISVSVLTAISDDKLGVEAAYKYFLISLLASMFLLIACGTLYATYGTLNMADLAIRIKAEPNLPLTLTAMVFLLVFFMIKSAVVPFHFWPPDFHAAAPTPVSAMLSSVVVKLGVYGFIRMITLLFIDQAESISMVLLILGILGVLFGGFGAMGTSNAKRMLAYSTIGQIGFILVAIGWSTPLSLAAALIFIFNHSLIKSALLMMAGVLASRLRIKSAEFSLLAGSGKTKPVTGLLFIMGSIALAGIPPMNGFISKLSLFLSGLDAEAYLTLAIIGIASLLTLVYMIRAFVMIWLQTPESDSSPLNPGDHLLVPALLIAFCLILGLWAAPLVHLTQQITVWLSDPSNFIRAVIGN